MAGSTSAHWVFKRPSFSRTRKLGTSVTCRGSTMTTISRKRQRFLPGKGYLAKPNPASTDSTTWPATIRAHSPRVLQKVSR